MERGIREGAVCVWGVSEANKRSVCGKGRREVNKHSVCGGKGKGGEQAQCVWWGGMREANKRSARGEAAAKNQHEPAKHRRGSVPYAGPGPVNRLLLRRRGHC